MIQCRPHELIHHIYRYSVRMTNRYSFVLLRFRVGILLWNVLRKCFRLTIILHSENCRILLLEVKREFEVNITEKKILWKHVLKTFHKVLFDSEAEQYEAVSIHHSHTVWVIMMDQFVSRTLYHTQEAAGGGGRCRAQGPPYC